MNRIKCIIVEDQAPAQRILKYYISPCEQLELCGTFTNVLDANLFINRETIHLMFLDIHLPHISGMDFLKSLQHPPYVILTTAFSNYAVESYELNVLDYLVKPFSWERFQKAIAKIPVNNSTFFGVECVVKSGHEYIKLNSNDILYIHADMDYTEIYTNEKKILSSDTLLNWEAKLKAHGFARVHRSYLVNLTEIARLSGNQLFLSDETVIPIGRAFKENLTEQWIK